MDIDRIDHIGVYVTDMDAAVSHLSALGFVVTPPSGVLSASATPSGPKKQIGTVNRVAVLGPSFLEIVTTDDPQVEAAGPQPWRVRPRGPWPTGPCIVGFGTSDVAGVDRRWRDDGLRTTGVVQFEAAMKAVVSGVSVADCAIVSRDSTPEGLVLSVEFPPGNRRSDKDRAHVNTAAALTAAYLTVEDSATVSRYETLLGGTAEKTDSGYVIPVPGSATGSRVHLGTSAQLTAILPGIRTDIPAPCFSAIGVGVRSLDAVADRLRQSGMTSSSIGAKVVVADPASNLVIAFEQLP